MGPLELLMQRLRMAQGDDMVMPRQQGMNTGEIPGTPWWDRAPSTDLGSMRPPMQEGPAPPVGSGHLARIYGSGNGG
jgi:hypothetical protein